MCSINQIEHGQQFLSMYLQLKDEGLDWEESLQLATYYLKNNHVNEIEKFEFDNVILLNYEVLSHPRNKNAMKFFIALCDWNIKRGVFNIYIEHLGKLHLCQQVRIQEPIKFSNPFERQV